MIKKEVRQQVFAMRKKLSGQWIEENSRLIFSKVWAYLEKQQNLQLFAYASYGGEVDTTKFLEKCFAKNISAALPKVSENGVDMEFYDIHGFSDLESGYHGILEPVQGLKKADTEGKNCVMIVPGVGFDRRGNRIGYGKGFYDRYLGRFRDIQKIGVAFSFQIFDEIVCEQFDEKMDLIITEKENIPVDKQ